MSREPGTRSSLRFGAGELNADKNAGTVSAEDDGPIGNRHNPEQTLRARSPGLVVTLASLLLWISTVQEEPAKPGEQSSAAPIADFSGTWQTTAMIRRTSAGGASQTTDRFQSRTRLTQTGAEVTGTFYVSRNNRAVEGRISGHVERRTLRFEARTRGVCFQEFEGESTLSVSGDRREGHYSGRDCNGPLQATTISWRVGTARSHRGRSYVQALEEGEALLRAGVHRQAVRSFREALKKTDEPSYRILIGLARSHNGVGAFKDGRAAAQKALEIASGPQEASDAYFELGVALLARSNDRPRPLADSEEAFRQALDLSGGTLNMARYRLGQVLLKLERNLEGVALLEEFLQADPDALMAPGAEELIKSAKKAMKP